MAKKKERRKAELEKQLRNNIIKALDSGLAFSLDELLAALGKRKDSFSVGILREMEDEGVILTSSNGKIKMNTYG